MEVKNYIGEVWKDIADYEGLYQVSNFGRVRSLKYRKTEKIQIMKSFNRNSYLAVCLAKDSRTKFYNIHRLVAAAFLPNPNNLPCVNHKNEIKTDNRVENLEWCSYSYNNKYSNVNDKSAMSRRKPVIQYSSDNVILNIFKSATEASKQTGCNRNKIGACCLGKRKMCGGYRWSFIEE